MQKNRFLKYVSSEKGKEILDEIHSGGCGNHAASRTLVGKAFRSGFYWPTALKDAEKLVRKYKGCRMFTRQAHVSAHNLICLAILLLGAGSSRASQESQGRF
jgi:hypothetical protein